MERRRRPEWNFPARAFGACARLSKRRPAFVDDEIQEALPLSLKPNYKIVLLRANPSSSPFHSVKVEIYSLWISRIQMLNISSISSPDNSNFFFQVRFVWDLSDGEIVAVEKTSKLSSAIFRSC